MIEALLFASGVALTSLLGAAFFGDRRRLEGMERYVVPGAVGVFLSLVLFELIPETLHGNEMWGGVVVAAGFLAFYILSYELHRFFHPRHEEGREHDRKDAATLLLIGDGIHNIADGIVLGAAFIINPAIGAATAVALALHEIPQEIVEFGVLVRAGYTRREAALRNLLSASSIVLGVALTYLLASHAAEYIWIITGFAAGNLLYIAATDLLPRVHGTLRNYGSFWLTVGAIVLGFSLMTATLAATHEYASHEEAGHAADSISL